jgi:hypothetical protein
MLKKLIKGLIFGAGFASAVVVILLLADMYLIDRNHQYNSGGTVISTSKWNSFSKEQQISKASVIAVVRYSKGNNGSMVAEIANFYKDNEEVLIGFKIGDKYSKLDYYPKSTNRLRSGVVVFFTGSPAKERSTLYLYEDRVLAYGDMPLEILIKLFKGAGSDQTN